MTEVWVIVSTGYSHAMGADEETTELVRTDPYFPKYHPAFSTEDAAKAYLDAIKWSGQWRAERLEVR